MDATGYSCWFERLLAELGFEVWIGDPAEIKAKRAKKQKTDRQDAQLLLKLFPAWNISACNARPATKYASWITWDLTL
jgi:transposase